jgi:uncharacterized membrane protein (DUF485 family)
MKNYIKKLKELSWKKMLAKFIVNGTLFIFGLSLVIFILVMIYAAGCVAWQSYSSCPSGFHWLFGVLVFIGTWMWSFNWGRNNER